MDSPLFELDFNLKFPLLHLLQFLSDLKSTITGQPDQGKGWTNKGSTAGVSGGLPLVILTKSIFCSPINSNSKTVFTFFYNSFG